MSEQTKTGQSCLATNENVTLQWLRFIRDRRWSRAQKLALLMHFGSIEGAVSVTSEEASRIVTGRRRRNVPAIDEGLVRAELAWLEQPEHHLITCFDSRYPELLRHITDPPIAFYAAGDTKLLMEPKVALVGSRQPTSVGCKIASEIASTLSSVGVAVVSGLALGVDGIAHDAALSANGPTIAVMGSGIDIVYPNRHALLHQRVLSQGLIISEYPLGFEPSRYTFPDRNRLVSGLSTGVVIVEAAERSGTLITARLATEQNRELMVVPGAAVSKQYEGSHRLIRDGAALVCSGHDVLAQLASQLSAYCKSHEPSEGEVCAPEEHMALTAAQAEVLAALDFVSMSIDAVIERSGLSASDVAEILLQLELNAMVATTREGGYIRTA